MEMTPIVLIALVTIYFFPTIRAGFLGKANGTGGVFLVNLLLGWTLIGWLVSFIWACSMRRFLLALAASTALATPALATTVDFDCTATKVVDRREKISPDTFWAAAHTINTPEYRRITTSDESGAPSLTYGLGQNKPQNWTLPITNVGKDGDKYPGIEAKSATPDQWGYRRWVYLDLDKKDDTIRFWTMVEFPDRTYSAALGTCDLTKESLEQFEAAKRTKPNQELRDPGTKTGPKTWEVPIEHKHGAIELNGMMNDAVPIRFALDTGATITNIPYDLAKRLGAKVIREQMFKLADGTVVTNQIILIKKLSIGGQVAVDGIEASVSESGTRPLLGKNLLDSFSSYEINNAQSQLILRK